jgi:hypothetical protein
MSEELEKRQVPEQQREPRFYEGSWVGQFRAIDNDRAKLFAHAVARAMEEFGVQDVGVSYREGTGQEFSDDEGRVTLTEQVPRDILHESVSNDELQRQLRDARKRVGDGE